MAQQTWINLLNGGAPWQTTQGTTLSTATTATISPQAPGPQDFVLPGQPGGLQWYAGMVLRVTARCTLTTGGTTSNLTVLIAAGVSGTLGTTLCTTGAIVLGTTSLTAQVLKLEALIRVIAIRSDANTFLDCQGDIEASAASAPTLTTASGVTVPLPYTTTNGSSLSPWTAATALGLRATLSAAFGSIQCNHFTIEQMS
jgi:hypothetical protein